MGSKVQGSGLVKVKDRKVTTSGVHLQINNGGK